jgi:hypothetical protein
MRCERVRLECTAAFECRPQPSFPAVSFALAVRDADERDFFHERLPSFVPQTKGVSFRASGHVLAWSAIQRTNDTHG